MTEREAAVASAARAVLWDLLATVQDNVDVVHMYTRPVACFATEPPAHGARLGRGRADKA